MSLGKNLQELERIRERYWLAYPATSPTKLRWRALTVRHCFHVLPGQTVLEIGAGSGIWTRHLSEVLRHENHITCAVFNHDYACDPRWQTLSSARPVHVKELHELPSCSFDYVVGTAILCHTRFEENLREISRLLKPGGQMLFFENNFWNPQVLAKSALRLAARCCGYVSSQIGLRKYDLMRAASHSGFTDIDVIPYDLIHPLLPSFLVRRVQSMAFVIEHAPLLKELCGTLYIWARKPGHTATSSARLSTHSQFRKAVSFVIPCHNEEMNIGRLVDAVLTMYGAYVHEMIIVNDNSSDGTARVAHALSERDPRIRSIDRNPPNGVGRALRDGCAAATGEYILMMDCDFVQIVPELRDLFDAVAEGYDGAIGSRFTHESIMMNYPFAKILCNRTFHFLANVALSCHVHDVSNNLKLYRAEILKTVGIEQPHFAANAEIGLRPILAGYRIKEVPISWINRAHDMGASSFYLPTVAPGYVWALWKLVRSIRELRRASAAERALRCARTHEGPTRLK